MHNIHFSWQNWASRCENPALNALPRAQFLPQRKLHLRVPHTAASWGTPASPLGTVAFQKYRSEPELLITLYLLGISKRSEVQGNTLDKPRCILHPRKSFMHWMEVWEVWHVQSPLSDPPGQWAFPVWSSLEQSCLCLTFLGRLSD